MYSVYTDYVCIRYITIHRIEKHFPTTLRKLFKKIEKMLYGVKVIYGVSSTTDFPTIDTNAKPHTLFFLVENLLTKK